MSIELAAVLATCLIEIVFLGSILYKIHSKMSADDAAIYLQGRRIQDLLRALDDEPARDR